MMDVQNNLNNYQTLGMYERKITLPENPTIQPVPKPETPQPELTPEQKLDVKYAVSDTINEYQDKKQQQKDNLRAFTMDYVGVQSKKTQAQIYLSVALDENVDLTQDIKMYDSLQDIKKQNDTIKGYALYKELQQKTENSFVA